MPLAKDRMPHDSNMAFINHGHDYYKDLLCGSSSFEFADHLSSPGIYEHDFSEKMMTGGINQKSAMTSRSSSSSSSSLSSSTSTNSSGVLNHVYHHAMTNYEHEEGGHSVISFKGGSNDNNIYSSVNADGSLLSFEQVHDYSILDHENNDDIIIPRGIINNVRLLENFNSIQTASSSSSSYSMKEKHYGDEQEPFGWLNSQAITDQESTRLAQELPSFHKRPHMLQGESMQTLKKQCTSAAAAAAARKPKPKSATSSTQYSSKDPQSIAAKNRRERISERLKILQDLVPNGSNVDLVTMLEKAISYVKFLQLQVKVLGTDELWPVEGGKAPELSQVKDAIDAILGSQRDTNSTYLVSSSK